MKDLSLLEDILQLPSPVEEYRLPQFEQNIIIKRDDLIHPVISGNKWRKLKGHLSEFDSSKHKGIISMGGLYSNHLHALSFVCYYLDIPFVALIYGIQSLPQSKIIHDYLAWNTTCIPISRVTAEQLRNSPLSLCFPSFETFYWIEEGGGGAPGRKGIHQLMSEMPDELDRPENVILVGCGTGTTIQGILEASQHIRVASIKIVSKATYNFANHPRMIWMPLYFDKKFSYWNSEMQNFKLQFENETQIFVDKIYAVPLLMAFQKFQKQSLGWQHIYYLHTGGRQEI
jgi:1-aminocyclopropane-1-carboxylate deaminase